MGVQDGYGMRTKECNEHAAINQLIIDMSSESSKIYNKHISYTNAIPAVKMNKNSSATQTNRQKYSRLLSI